MIVPGSVNPLLLRSAAATGYQVSRSLRFNSSDSAFCSRTPASAGNRKTWTWAAWVKRSSLATGDSQFLFSAGSTNRFALLISTGNNIEVHGNGNVWRSTSAVFRDPSAWYHLMCVVNTPDATEQNRIRLYVNGTEVTTWSTNSAVTQNTDFDVNSAVAHNIARNTEFSNRYFDGYLADIHFIDGQALTPSSFTEVSATTGQLVPKAYTGTFGTNGFKLSFSDNSGTTSTTLGKDAAGSNDWTPNNFSVASGSGNDSLVDTPTSYGTDTGAGGEVRGNYATFLGTPLAAVASNFTRTNGNLDASGSNANQLPLPASIFPSSGKWYCELVRTSGSGARLGVVNVNGLNEGLGNGPNGWCFLDDGRVFYNGSASSYGSAIATNDIFMIALDIDAGKVWYGNNGTWFASGNPATGANASQSFTAGQTMTFAVATGGACAFTSNWGARPFAYTAPSGFKALVDTNLAPPLVAKPSSAFDCVTYTGTGATLTPTSSLGFSPDLVWIKSRSAATDHTIYDAVRGTQARLESNNTDPEVTSDGGLTAFNSNGFTLGTLAQVNTNAATYVAWCWDEAVADGFDIVTYTGNGANRTIAHSLGVSPSFMIVKQRTAASATNWAVWHSSLANTEYLLLNSTAAKATGATYWNSTSPTSTNFSLGTAADVNTNNGTYVAYLWSSVVGYSSFGSYTGTSTSDGSFVYCGFRPRFVLIKNTDGSSPSGIYNWVMYDSARSTYNVNETTLYSNTSDQENTTNGTYNPNNKIDFLSNGFKIRGNSWQINRDGSATYIYAAFAESPFQFSRAR